MSERYMWQWFVYDGDESWPIRYSGPHYDDAKAAYLRHSNKESLPDGWHIWHGSRRVEETVIIGSGMSGLTKSGKRRKPEPEIIIIIR